MTEHETEQQAQTTGTPDMIVRIPGKLAARIVALGRERGEFFFPATCARLLREALEAAEQSPGVSLRTALQCHCHRALVRAGGAACPIHGTMSRGAAQGAEAAPDAPQGSSVPDGASDAATVPEGGNAGLEGPVGPVAYEQFRFFHRDQPPWEDLGEVAREVWGRIGKAVLDETRARFLPPPPEAEAGQALRRAEQRIEGCAHWWQSAGYVPGDEKRDYGGLLLYCTRCSAVKRVVPRAVAREEGGSCTPS